MPHPLITLSDDHISKSLEIERLAALRDYGILDSGPEIGFDDISRIAAQVSRSPISLISLVDQNRQWLKSACGIDLKQTSRDASFCTHAILQSGIFVVPDALNDLRFVANPLVTGAPYIRFYAGVPLEMPDGFRLGTLCIIDTEPRPNGLEPEQADTLEALARSVVSLLELRRANRNLRRVEERYQALIRASAAIEFRAAPDGFVLESQGWTEFCGQARINYAGHGWVEVLHPEDRAVAALAWRHILALGEPGTVEYRVRVLDGTYRWVLARVVPLRQGEGPIREWVGTVTDIHDQRAATEKLRISEDRLRLAARATFDAIWDWDLTTDQVTWGDGARTLLGHSPGSDTHHSGWWKQHLHADDRDRVTKSLRAAIAATDSNWSADYRFKHKAGHWIDVQDRGFLIRNDDGQAVRIVGAMQDITARKAAEADLWRTAHHDPLTGLPNRTLFRKRKREAIRNADQNQNSVGLIYIDIDDFKDINDTLGHDAGDCVLIAAAERLKAHVPSSATVARVGGDDFTVLLPGSTSMSDVESVAKAALACLAVPISHAGQDLNCTASAGIAIFPDSDPCPDSLLKNANIALYAAKKAGRSRYAVFNGNMRQDVQRRMSVFRSVRELLARDAIVPFYQPKVDLRTGAITGFEALLRWKDRRGCFQAPGEIREAFDNPNLSVEIGQRMLDRVLRDIQGWRKIGVPFGNIALNIAAQEFAQIDVADNILSKLSEMHLPNSLLEIEVTETVFLGDGSEAVGRALSRLHERGVPIALDDFGTGYASLTHLKQYSVDWLKIDRSFVQDIGTDAGGAAIVKAVIELSRSLGIRVVAEGIETSTQMEFLKQEGCDLGQGYLYARPMPGSELPQFVKNWRLTIAPTGCKTPGPIR